MIRVCHPVNLLPGANLIDTISLPPGTAAHCSPGHRNQLSEASKSWQGAMKYLKRLRQKL